MKNKIIIIISIITIMLVLGVIYSKTYNKYDGAYEIKVVKFDEKSPDRHLIVLKDGKETKKYEYIKYNNDKNITVCKVENPTVNMYDIDVEELVIVFSNNSEAIAKVIREEKWKRKYF